MSLKESETMCLSIQDLNRMKQEFLDCYEKLFSDAFNRLRRALTLKLRGMKQCGDRFDQSHSPKSRKSDAFMD